MKRMITCGSQLATLNKIANDIGSRARVNREHHCVDVLDPYGNVKEQHYAIEVGRVPKSKFRYNYVGPGNGSYDRVYYDSRVKDYTDVDHLIKYVDHTNKDIVTSSQDTCSKHFVVEGFESPFKKMKKAQKDMKNTADSAQDDVDNIKKQMEEFAKLNGRSLQNVQSSEDMEVYDENHEEKFGKHFEYIDIDSPEARRYLDQDPVCKKNETYIKNNRRGEIAVCVEDDTLAGYIFVYKKGKKEGCIQPLYIFPEYRGYKVSEVLLEDAIDNYGAVDLHVKESNTVAINLYEKYGFEIVKDDTHKGLLYMQLYS